MRISSLLFRERIQHCRFRQASVLLPLLLSCLAILIAPGGTSSHEPITTKILFNREIVRIFQRHCLACHNSGSTTNISLATYNRARPWAKAFKEEVLEKRMPPFQAVKGFGRFHDDYSLTQHEVDQIVSWVEGGAPKGDDKDLPPDARPWVAGNLVTPILFYSLRKPVNISSGAGDEYRCIVLPTNLKKAQWVTAVDFHPGGSAAVHCASFGIDLSPVRQTSEDPVDLWGREGNERGSTRHLDAGSGCHSLAETCRPLAAGRGSHRVTNSLSKGREATNSQSSLGLYFATGPAMKPLTHCDPCRG